MRLRLNTPNEVMLDEAVTKVTAEGIHGLFCLLPQHIDFLAALVPGLLSWENESGDEAFAAVGTGVLVKQGDRVLVSTEQATHGGELSELKRIVQNEFSQWDERQRAAHEAIAMMEASFLRQTMNLVRDEVA
ncbi:MAG: F0F1 ATP synthase subunit epsilon [Planctomycetales bacterium]|nr:F0F1 ATP synthase subunit epsilon [Planctomycetales bacterium]